MPQRVEERVRPITPQLAWRVAVLGGIAFVLFGIVFFRLWYLQVLTGQEAVTQAATTACARCASRRRAATSSTATTSSSCAPRPPRSSRWCPSQLPESVREDADDLPQEPRRRRERRACEAQDSYDAFRRQLRDDGRKDTKADEARARARCASRPRRRAPVPVPAVRLRRDRADRALQAHGPRAADLAEDDPQARDPRDRRRAVLQRHDPHRRAARAVQLHARARRVVQGRRRRRSATCAAIRRSSSPRSCSDGRRDHARSSSRRSATRASRQGTRIGQSGLEKHYDKYLRGTDGSTRVVVDALGSRDDQRTRRGREPKQGQRLKLTLDSTCRRPATTALTQGDRRLRATGARAGALRGDGPARRRDPAPWARAPSFDANDVRQADSRRRPTTS